MSVTNDFVPFCYQDTGTNLESQADYLVEPQRTIGNQPGIASSQLVNKALRQGTAVAANIAQYVANQANINTLDNGNEAQLLSQIMGALQPLSPVLTQYLSGTGTWNATVYFFCASANATAGATYTNNAVTYTVVNTITSGLVLQTNGNGAPTANGGTLTKSSGTGDSTITFYAYRNASWLNVEMVGGGGGGAGGGSSSSSGGNGTSTTFGSSFLIAGGGNGGIYSFGGGCNGGTGGTATIGVGATGLALAGGSGSGGYSVGVSADVLPGAAGGSTPFGGSGGGTSDGTSAGFSATPNTGSGGGGGSSSGADNSSGGGGGAGSYIKAYVYTPGFNYTYSLGVEGTGGTGNQTTGGDGGSGLIKVVEYFQ